MTIFTNTHERRRRETMQVAEVVSPPRRGLSMADDARTSEAKSASRAGGRAIRRSGC